jgi:hypothetical protein
VLLQHLDEAAHVRALGVVRQADRQADRGDRRLALGRLVQHGDRVAKTADPDLFDGDLAVIGAALGVLEDRRRPRVPGAAIAR